MSEGIPHTRSSYTLTLPPDFPGTRTERKDLLSLDTSSAVNFVVLARLARKAVGGGEDVKEEEEDSKEDSDVELIGSSEGKDGKRKGKGLADGGGGGGTGEGEGEGGGARKKVKLNVNVAKASSSSKNAVGSTSNPIDLDSSDEDDDVDDKKKPPSTFSHSHPTSSPSSSSSSSLPLLYHTLVLPISLPPQPPRIPSHPIYLNNTQTQLLKDLQTSLAQQFKAKNALLGITRSLAVGQEINLGQVFLFGGLNREGGPSILSEPPTEAQAAAVRLSKQEKEVMERSRVLDCWPHGEEEEEEEGGLKSLLNEAGFRKEEKGRWGEYSWLHALSLLVTPTSTSPALLNLSTNLCLTKVSRRQPYSTYPFTLALRFRLSLPISSLSASSSLPAQSHLLEAQRLLFTSLLPPPPKPTAFPSHNETTLPFFYSILEPAPEFRIDEEEADAQPEGLGPELYPFQKRTVRWMLEREGKRLSHERPGTVEDLHVQKGERGLFCWEEVEVPLRRVPPFGELVERVEWKEEEEEEEVGKGKGKGRAREVGERKGKSFWFDRLTGGLVEKEEDVKESRWFVDLVGVKGGMLCEEMGLGKTLEVISIILLNPADKTSLGKPYSSELKLLVKPVKATLIVAPPSLTQQWVDEIGLHSPSLKVYVYDGYRKLPFSIVAGKIDEADHWRLKRPKRQRRGAVVDSDEEEDEHADFGEKAWWDHLEKGDYDVVITTYGVLSNELTVAKPGGNRPRRATTEYSDHLKSRSPLVMSEWYRVVMDEVQLQGNGVIAEMVSLLPRRSSFAVSGTPAKNHVKDLQQSLKFLRVPTLGTNTKLWNRLLCSGFSIYFEELFGVIATRTTKKRVKNEMRIPTQRRVLFPIDLSAVEFAFYTDVLSRALENLDPAALDLQSARTWLFTLRQVATHVQIGQLRGVDGRGVDIRGRRGGGEGIGRGNQHGGRGRMHLGDNLLTIGEVLEKMLEGNEGELAVSRKAELVSKTTHALLLVSRQELDLGNDRGDQDTRDALTLYQDVLAKVNPLILECEQSIADLGVERLALRAARKLANPKDNGKGKQREDLSASEDSDRDPDDSEGSEESREDEKVARTPAEKANSRKLANLKLRLRELHECKHRVTFFLGDWYHVAGQEVEEAAFYAEAEGVRRAVLREPESAANSAISRMKRKLARTDVDQEEMEVEYCDKGGLLTSDLVEQANEVIDLLNDNRELVWNWRGKIVTLLSSSLDTAANEDDGVNGEEYNKALDEQAEVEAYLQAYVSALADRRELLSENRTALAQADAREVRHRGTNRAKEASLAGLELGLVGEDQTGLKDQLMQARAALRLNPPKMKKGSIPRQCIKTLVLQFTEAGDRSINRIEQTIAEKERTRLRRVIKDQEIIIAKLEDELDLFRTAFNDRINFFKWLQDLSDSVVAVEVAGLQDLEVKLMKCITEEATLVNGIAAHLARHRFLSSMNDVFNGELGEDDRECIICRDDIDKGVLLDCSHLFCADCFKTLTRTCPVCRAVVDRQAAHRIILKRPEEKAKVDEAEPAANDSKGKGKAKELLPAKKRVDEATDVNYVSRQDRDAIFARPLFGDWGSKVNMMVKHLLHLRATDPDSKAVVFSAFPDALIILRRAMDENGIRYVSTGGSNSRTVARTFKTDPLIQVFLLHSEKESAGLTLTVAKYVFLLEPTLSPSFELQAIGRVDRLGQTQETTVFCFVVNETVDANIVRLSVAKGTSIYLKQAQGTALPIDIMRPKEEVDGTVRAGVNVDFVAKADDLFSLLFPDRLGLNRGRANIIDLSDDDEEEELDVDAQLARALAKSPEPALTLEVDMEEDDEIEHPVAGPSRLG